jgi:hypothetical protein
MQGQTRRTLASQALAQARAAWKQVRHAPGRVNAAAYAGLRLNRVFHACRFPAPLQFALVPRQLQVSRRLMSVPYRVPMSLLRWGGRPSGGEQRKGLNGRGAGLILDGDWDLEDKRPIQDYLESYIYSKTVFDIFRDGKPPEATPQFAEMMRHVSRGGGQWQARGCLSTADVLAYFERMHQTFEQIRRGGYRSQAELGLDSWMDEIKVFVDRHGELHKLQGAGHHRLAMARLLAVPQIPVLVLGVHRLWATRMQARFGVDVITAVDLGLSRLGEVGPGQAFGAAAGPTSCQP